MIKYIVQHGDSRIEFIDSERASLYAQENALALENIEQVEVEAVDLLVDKKRDRCIDIDVKTQQIIRQGFDFDGHKFSLSTNAQVNWLGMKTLSSMLEFPVECTTDDDQAYMLAEENLDQFTATAVFVVQSTLASGRALKVAINAAQTQEELDSIVDHR